MPSIELLVPFFLATVIFSFTPGPGMLYMAVQTMAHGARAGWFSSVAFHLAGYLHIAAAAFGVTVLLVAAPVLLIVLKLVGGLYLIWMGLRLWRQPRNKHSTPSSPAGRSSARAFRDSFMVEVLNPKMALFYFAFLPQFTAPEAALPIWAQVVALGAMANFVFSLADLVCISFARAVASQTAAYVPFAVWGRRLGGTILIGMGTNVIVKART